MSQDPGGATSVLIIIGLLVASAFASSSETSLFSLNRFQLRRLREKYQTAYQRIKTLLASPGRTILLILLINETVNIQLTSYITSLTHDFSGRVATRLSLTDEAGIWIVSSAVSMLVTLPLLLIIGEITPKIIAVRMNKFVAIFNSKLLIVFYRLLYPLLYATDLIINLFLKRDGSDEHSGIAGKFKRVSEEDFMVMMEEGHREGTVNQDERELITNVLEFDDSTVSEVMTPIDKVFAVPDNMKLGSAWNDLRGEKYSRVPVYSKNKKNIIGLLLVKSIIKLRTDPTLAERTVRELMTEVNYVRPDTRLSVMFRRFKSTQSHIAIVLGKNEDAIGIVTMENVLESIFGDIEDENDVRDSK